MSLFENVTNKSNFALGILVITTLSGSVALAGEGGSSAYRQGTFNDFQAGVFGPAGVYFRKDLMYFDTTAEARPQGGRVAAEVDQSVWIALLKIAYLTDSELFGARVGFAATIPIVYADVSGALAVPEVGSELFGTGSQTGFGDVYLNPLMLNWTNGYENFTFAPGLVLPTGKYDADETINLGRNYWAFDLAGSYTYFNPNNGREFSATAGILFNGENGDTDYQTGTEFHIDFLAAQYFSESFGLGLAGYYYEQLTDDEGQLAGGLSAQDLDGGFRGSGWGAGPAFVYNTAVGDTTVSVIGKAIFDIESENRFESDTYSISAAWKF
ncbi:MAG: transporter [Pseudomonadota bacterium]